MQHSNCYLNVKNIDHSLNTGDYLTVKLDLVGIGTAMNVKILVFVICI